MQPDGSATTIYNNQIGQTYTRTSASGVSSPSFTETMTWNPYIPADSTHYFAADHLGTARMEFAGPGWPVWSEDYAPYGQEVSPAATSNIYKFTSYERDPETAIAGGTGDDYAQARYYSSTIQGRFTSPDPYSGSMDMGNPQSFNRYAYALNNPVKFVDPSGLQTVCSTYTEGGYYVLGDYKEVSYWESCAAFPDAPAGTYVGVQGCAGCGNAGAGGNPLAKAPNKPAPNNCSSVFSKCTRSQKAQPCMDKLNNSPDGKFNDFFSFVSPLIGPDASAGEVLKDISKEGFWKFIKTAATTTKGSPLGKVSSMTFGLKEAYDATLAPVVAGATVAQLLQYGVCHVVP